MREYLSRTVEYEPERVVIHAIEQRAPAKLLIIVFATGFVFRTVGRYDTVSSVLIVAFVIAVALLLWAMAPRRTIVFDQAARKIEVSTRRALRGTDTVVIDFDSVKHCSVSTVGGVWLWNVDTREHSLTLCSFRDEFDGKRLQSMVSATWPKR